MFGKHFQIKKIVSRIKITPEIRISSVILSALLIISGLRCSEASMAETKKQARNARVECVSAKCSISVGLLVSATKNETSGCTTTLVSRDIVATNAHCVPPDIRKPGTNCRDRIYIHFAPQIAHPEYEASATCESVLVAEGADGDGDTPDYAFLRISRVQARPYLNLRREGFRDENTYYIDAVDEVSKNNSEYLFRQHTVKCRAIQHTMVAPRFTSQFGPIALLSDCEENIIHGNSGSAVRDDQNNIQGMVFAIVEDSEKKKIRSDYALIGMTLPENLPDYAFVTSFSCLKLPQEIDRPTPLECRNTILPNRSQVRIDEAFAKNMNESVGGLRFISPAYGWAKWKLENKGGVYYYKPTCVRPDAVILNTKSSTGLSDFRIKTTLDKYSRFIDQTISVSDNYTNNILVIKDNSNSYKVNASGRTYIVPPC